MILLMHDLTDLLGDMADGPYWFVKRKHQGEWYYLGNYDEVQNSITWTKNQEYASTFAQESSAKQLVLEISDHSPDLKIHKEMLED